MPIEPLDEPIHYGLLGQAPAEVVLVDELTPQRGLELPHGELDRKAELVRGEDAHRGPVPAPKGKLKVAQAERCTCAECRALDALPAEMQGIPGAYQLRLFSGRYHWSGKAQGAAKKRNI